MAGMRLQTHFSKMLGDLLKVVLLEQACLACNELQQEGPQKQSIQSMFVVLAFSQTTDPLVRDQVVAIFWDLGLALEDKFRLPLEELAGRQPSQKTLELLGALTSQLEDQVPGMLEVGDKIEQRGKHWSIATPWKDPAETLREFTRKKENYVAFLQLLLAQRAIIPRAERVASGFHI
jgi:hypothetical protein